MGRFFEVCQYLLLPITIPAFILYIIITEVLALVRKSTPICTQIGHEYYLADSMSVCPVFYYDLPSKLLVEELIEHKWKGTTPYFYLECTRCWKFWGEYHPDFHRHVLIAKEKGFVSRQEETRRFLKIIGREDLIRD